MAKLSKGFYLSSPIVSAASLVLVGVGMLVLLEGSFSSEVPPFAIFLFVIGVLGLIYASVVSLIFIYKIWEAIADQYARTSPGKAVGFLFIPFFNVYWIFQVFWGFAKDCNAYIDRNSINTNKLPEGLFLACAIMQLTLGIPYLNFLAGIAYAVLFAIAISKTCDAINTFGEKREGVNAGGLLLHFLSGEFANDSLEIPASGLSIGRDPSKANLIFASNKISALHAKLTPHGQGQVSVEDVNSLNGTFYRQQRVGGQNVGWEWVRLRGQMLMAVGARLRLADDVAEFEIRKA